jgi:hypothetical protein
MSYGTKTKNKKPKKVIMIAVGELKPNKNGKKRNGKKKRLS